MRWILLIVAIVGFAIAFTTQSPNLMGVGLLFGCIGLLGFGWALAAARVAANSQSETMMIADPDIRALRAKAQAAKVPVAPPQRSMTNPPATSANPDQPTL